MLKKILFGIFVFITGSIVLVAALVMSVLNWPTLLINTRTLDAIRGFAPRIGLDLSWKRADVAMQSHGFCDETVTFTFEDICAAYTPTLERACFAELAFGLRYQLRSFIPHLAEIGPLTATGGEIELALADEKQEKPKQSKPIPLALPKIALPFLLRHTSFHPIAIELKELRIAQAERTINGTVSLNVDVTDANELKDALIEVTLSGLDPLRRLEAKAALASASHFRKGDMTLNLDLTTALADGGMATLHADADVDRDRNMKTTIDASLARQKLKANATFEGSLTDIKIFGQLKANATDLTAQLPKLTVEGCTLSLSHQGFSGNDGQLELNCTLDAFVKAVELPNEVDKFYQAPEHLRLELASKIDTFFHLDPEHRTKGHVNLKMVPVQSQIISNGGTIDIDVDGIPAQFPTNWKIASKVNIDFLLKRFQNLVAMLENSPTPIPAPFNELSGAIELSIEGGIEYPSDFSRLPVVLRTKLTGTQQRIDIDATVKGELRFTGTRLSEVGVEGDVTLDDVELRLPKLIATSIPRFFPDSRIALKNKPKEKKAKPNESLPFHYKLTIKTGAKPIRIITNLVETPIPITIDVQLDEDNLAGTIEVMRFPVELFRRKGTIDHLKLTLQKPLAKSLVEGLAIVKNVDYTVNMNVVGPMEKPQFLLTSDPPLSQEDIIAVLIYGEPYSQLDGGDADNVSSTSAAMANRAFALTTMYLFASTPIQRIGYNPDTGTVVAKFRITEGTSLTVGSGGSSHQQVGLRRRLGHGWVVTTTVEPSTDGSPTNAEAFIEWNKRY